MMMRMQLNITLKYSMMNKLIIRERIYLSAKERYNITQKNDRDDEMIKTTRQIRSSFRPFVLSSSK